MIAACKRRCGTTGPASHEHPPHTTQTGPMNFNWQIHLKRAFRLAELMVAGALLAVLVELVLVHLDRPPAVPDVILIKRTKLGEAPAPTPAKLPTKAMPMQIAAKPVAPEQRPPVVQAPMFRNIAGEPGTSGDTTINFVSLLGFRHLRARFTQSVDEPGPTRTQANFSPNQRIASAAVGSSGKIILGTNQSIAQSNTVSGATNSVASANRTGGSISNLAATNNNSPAQLKPPTLSSASPAAGNIRLAIP